MNSDTGKSSPSSVFASDVNCLPYRQFEHIGSSIRADGMSILILWYYCNIYFPPAVAAHATDACSCRQSDERCFSCTFRRRRTSPLATRQPETLQGESFVNPRGGRGSLRVACAPSARLGRGSAGRGGVSTAPLWSSCAHCLPRTRRGRAEEGQRLRRKQIWTRLLSGQSKNRFARGGSTWLPVAPS